MITLLDQKNHINNKRIKIYKRKYIKYKKILKIIKKKLIQFFILVSLPEFTKFKNLMNVFIRTQLFQGSFQLCLDNKIKLVYSATSASLGNNE